jgi:hypothetical protein
MIPYLDYDGIEGSRRAVKQEKRDCNERETRGSVEAGHVRLLSVKIKTSLEQKKKQIAKTTVRSNEMRRRVSRMFALFSMEFQEQIRSFTNKGMRRRVVNRKEIIKIGRSFLDKYDASFLVQVGIVRG